MNDNIDEKLREAVRNLGFEIDEDSDIRNILADHLGQNIDWSRVDQRRAELCKVEIDWPLMEKTLIDICLRDIKKFAEEHTDEEFYGFTLDCNSEYGDVLLCLNTKQDLRKQAEKYMKLHREWPENKTLEDIEQDLRWNAGDWKHQEFNSKEFNSDWRIFAEFILDKVDSEEEDPDTFMKPSQEIFMGMACRVVFRLQSIGAFDCLNRTPDFRVFVSDHEDLKEDAWNRLQRVRSQTKSRYGDRDAH